LGRTAFAPRALLALRVVLSILTVTPVRAEEGALTLSQAVEYSLQNNGELKALRDEKGIRDAGIVRAGVLPNPTLDLEGATGAMTGSSAENRLSLGISQEFLLAGKRGKRLAVAERELEAYRWLLADRERLVREEVKTAFYEVLLAEQRVAYAERSIALSRQLFNVAQERLAAGDIPELEMNLAKVEVARREGAKIEAARALVQSRAKLAQVMNLPTGDRPAVAGRLHSTTALNRSLGDLKQTALDKRPDLKALQAERSRGDAYIALASAEGIPNLTAGVSVNRDTTTMDIGGVEGKDTAYTIGLRLSIPIPVFDKNREGVQEARAKRSSAESRLSAALANVEREVETAYASYVNSDHVLSLYNSSVMPQLEENVRLTQEAYSVGEVGILAVIEEQKKFSEVSENYLTALYDRQTALVKLESTVGTELTGGMQ